jgi:hypothetical protein
MLLIYNFCCSACGFWTLTCSPDLLPYPRPAVSSIPLPLSTAPAVSTSECSAMKSQLTFTPEVLTCRTLYNHCNYYLTPLVIYEHLEEQFTINGYVYLQYNLHRRSQKRSGHTSEPGSSLGFFINSCLSREFFLTTVLLHLHCLLFGVLGWVSV